VVNSSLYRCSTESAAVGSVPASRGALTTSIVDNCRSSYARLNALPLLPSCGGEAMRTNFVLSMLTGALIAGLNGSDVSFAFSFAGMLAVAGLTGITWQEHFQYADLGVALDTSHRRDHKPAFPRSSLSAWCGWTATHGPVAGGGVA
jgi:hypothetical protein